MGATTDESSDYPDFAFRVAEAVSRGEVDRGVLVCGTGIGMSIAANKVEGIRAGVVYDERTAHVSRSHNDTNVLCLGEDTVQSPLLDTILKIWLETPAEAGRHERRVGKIMEYEREQRATQKTTET
jgi:ribose 5-phosphate isomerase B